MSKGAAVKQISYLFDRPRNGGKRPWDSALTLLFNGDDIGRRAVVENWQIDHRIAQMREDAILSSGDFHSDPGDEEWWAQRRDHFSRALCLPAIASTTQSRAAYAEDYNATNLISANKLPRHVPLLHIASLNRLLWRLSSAEYTTADLKMNFLQLTGHQFPEQPFGGWDDLAFNAMVDEIVVELQNRGEDAVRELAGLLSDALGSTEPPWWAGFAMELNRYLTKDDWYQLCLALGLGHLDEGEWLLMWRYSNSQAGTLYRPTSVEANDSPFHFPSPPSYSYGVTMPLANGMSACREVIHAPLKGGTAQEACTGVLGRIADSPSMTHNSLVELRKAQRDRIGREQLETRDLNWLKRHPSKL